MDGDLFELLVDRGENMAFKNGVVEAANTRTLKFGTAIGLKIGEEWFGFISKKGDVSDQFKNKTVEFEYEVDEKGYKQIDKGTLKVVGAGDKASSAGAPPSKPSNQLAGIRSGMAVNNAVLAFANGKIAEGDIIPFARKVLVWAVQIEEELLNGIQVPAKEQAKPKPKPVVEDDFEDDVPF